MSSGRGRGGGSRNDRSSNRNEWQDAPSRNRQPALDQGLSNLTLGGHRVTSPRDNPYSALSTDGRPNPTENKPEKGPRKRANIPDEMHQAWLRGELDAQDIANMAFGRQSEHKHKDKSPRLDKPQDEHGDVEMTPAAPLVSADIPKENFNFHAVPKAIKEVMMLSLVNSDGEKKWLGTFYGKDVDQYRTAIKFDMGKFGDPYMKMSIKIHKDWTTGKRLDAEDEKSYIEVGCYWRPGLQGPYEGYQIDEIVTKTIQERIEQDPDAVPPEALALSDKHRDDYFSIRWFSSGFSAEGLDDDDEAWQNIQNIPGIDSSLLDWLSDLRKCPNELEVMGNFKKTRSQLAKGCILWDTAMEKRLPPFFQYRDTNDPRFPCDVTPNMEEITGFHRGMYINLSNAQQEKFDATSELPATRDMGGFHELDEQFYWSDAGSFQAVLSAAAVRDQQWQYGTVATLSRSQVSVFVLKTYRFWTDEELRKAGKRDRSELSEAQRTREDSFYIYCRIAKHETDAIINEALPRKSQSNANVGRGNQHGKKGGNQGKDDNQKKIRELMPPEGTLFTLDFGQQEQSKDPKKQSRFIQSDIKDKWIGKVVNVPNSELDQTGTDICLFMKKPKGARRIKAWDKLFKSKSVNLPQAFLQPVADTTSLRRQLSGLQQIGDEEGRPDLQDIRVPLLYPVSNQAQQETDLRAGPSWLPAIGGDKRRLRFESLLKVYQKKFNTTYNPGQQALFRSAAQIKRKIQLGLGAPGVAKTTSMAHLSCALAAVRHKVWITADANAAVDNAAVRTHAALQQFKEVCPPLQQAKGLRLQSIGLEMDCLKAKQNDQVDPETFQSTKWEAGSFEDDPMYKKLLEYVTAESMDMDTEAKFEDYLSTLQGLQDKKDNASKRLKKEYEDMTANMTKKLRSFPFEWSPGARVRRQIADDAEKSAQDGTANPTARYMELKNKLDAEGFLSPEEYKEFSRERVALFCRIIADTEFFFATCNNLASDLVQTALNDYDAKPSVVIIEEAGQCSIPSASIPLSLKGVEAFFLLGDPMQLTPLVPSEGNNEGVRLLKLSILEYLHRKGFPTVKLMTQYRMAPSIMQWISEYYYKGEMVCADEVKDVDQLGYRAAVKAVSIEMGLYGEGSEYFLVNTKYSRSSAAEGTTSLSNRIDARVMVKIAKRLVAHGVRPEHISMITFYRGQLKVIDFYSEKEELQPIVRDTTDSFQGRDNYVVLIDIVASALLKGGFNKETISSFARNPNRLNVALSRGRDGCIVVGNMNSFIAGRDKSLEADHSAVQAMVQNAAQRQVLVHDNTEDPLDRNSDFWLEIKNDANHLAPLNTLANRKKLEQQKNARFDRVRTITNGGRRQPTMRKRQVETDNLEEGELSS
jgi:hypothetical protein